MNRSKSNRISDLTTRLAAVALVLVLVFMSGCVAAPVVAVYYMATERVVTVAMNVDAPAPEVYRALVKSIRKKSPPGMTDTSFKEIIAEDEEKFFFEAKRVGSKGEELWGAIQVTPVSSSKSHVLFSGFGKDWPIEEIEDRVRQVLREFCAEGGYKCEVVKTGKERKAI